MLLVAGDQPKVTTRDDSALEHQTLTMVLLSALLTSRQIRKCFVESAMATVQQSTRTISVTKNDGNDGGPRVTGAYDKMFNFLLDQSLANLLPSLISATRIWDSRDRALRWLRMSRRHEFRTRLDNPYVSIPMPWTD